MFDFLKICGQGLLYILLSPFILAFFLLAALVATLGFVFNFFKASMLFFSGKSIFDPTPLELEAKQIIEQRKNSPAPIKYIPQEQPMMNGYMGSIPAQPDYLPNPNINPNVYQNQETRIEQPIIQASERGEYHD